ncbi:MAG: hypothetical protein JSV63_02815 [Candidatus Aenigmatarchaeota archaeon]|nr:MAG: hypothetical protein JSV63_02815 [Candidatus Aenigmarchaeota archaeon]
MAKLTTNLGNYASRLVEYGEYLRTAPYFLLPERLRLTLDRHRFRTRIEKLRNTAEDVEENPELHTHG